MMEEGIGAESLKEITQLVQTPPTMTEYLTFKKFVQEEFAKVKTAQEWRERLDHERDRFRTERRWLIGVIIGLVAIAAGAVTRLIP